MQCPRGELRGQDQDGLCDPPLEHPVAADAVPVAGDENAAGHLAHDFYPDAAVLLVQLVASGATWGLAAADSASVGSDAPGSAAPHPSPLGPDSVDLAAAGT